ncbi:hypothetical protein E3U26_23350 (plasmid) [Paracoccus ferrooxidans]|nr:hypothetical protein E3U26_23350 [Paracoccus ferrooxidans]
MTKRGIPSVVFVTERFTALARMARTGRGMPDLPTIVFPLNPQFYAEGEVARVTETIVETYVGLIAPGAVGLGRQGGGDTE